MDQERLRYSLLQAAEQLTDLANLIDQKGTVRLSQRQRGLIRAAMLPAVQEMCDQVILDYIQGTETDFDALKVNVQSVQVY